MDRFHSVYSIGRETSRRIFVVREESDKTASGSSLPSSTTMTPSRQEIDHPTSSLSSSTSQTMTVSSDSETKARQDLCGIDSYPVTVSSKHVEGKNGETC